MVTFASLFREKERLLQKRVKSAVELELRAWYLEATNELKYSSLQISNNCGPKVYIIYAHTYTHTYIHIQENILLHSLWTV